MLKNFFADRSAAIWIFAGFLIFGLAEVLAQAPMVDITPGPGRLLLRVASC
jgi:hypothetical protein